MAIKYPVLAGKIVERGIAKTKIAEAIGVSGRSFKNKMDGVTNFTWDEVCIIQDRFFPDMQMKELLISTTVTTGHRMQRRNNFSKKHWHKSKNPGGHSAAGTVTLFAEV